MISLTIWSIKYKESRLSAASASCVVAHVTKLYTLLLLFSRTRLSLFYRVYQSSSVTVPAYRTHGRQIYFSTLLQVYAGVCKSRGVNHNILEYHQPPHTSGSAICVHNDRAQTHCTAVHGACTLVMCKEKLII